MGTLVKTEGLTKTYFVGKKQKVYALRGINLSIESGQIAGLVGESGCGKTTLGRCLLRLVEPTKGRIFFDNIELTDLSQKQLTPLRQHMQMVFQDTQSAFDPRFTLGQSIIEPLANFQLDQTKNDRRENGIALLEMVGLNSDFFDRYPHQVSGGERQRAGIARALAVSPEFLVADEPISSLDLSIQAQIIKLLADLKAKKGLTYLYISHDLRMVQYLCDWIAIMYLGQIVERLPADNFFVNACHPYTKLIIATMTAFQFDEKNNELIEAVKLLSQNPPSPLAPPPGCPFHPRCPVYAQNKNNACTTQMPLEQKINPDHFVCCHEITQCF